MKSSRIREYMMSVEPLIGTPMTVRVMAGSDEEALLKAQRGFITPLIKVEIVGRHHTDNQHQEITWEYVGGFVDGEGHISWLISDRVRFHAYFEIFQTDAERGAIKLLGNIKAFIKKELGIEGIVRLRRPPAYYGLFYERAMDVYKLCHAILPHLRLGHRIRQAKSTMEAIEKWVKEKHEETGELVSRGYDRIIKGHHARYAEMLKEMEEIKREA